MRSNGESRARHGPGSVGFGSPTGSASTDDTPAKGSAVVMVARGRDTGRDLDAWAAAVEHLHAAGLPAAVPEFPAAWLRRRGIRADWVSAA